MAAPPPPPKKKKKKKKERKEALSVQSVPAPLVTNHNFAVVLQTDKTFYNELYIKQTMSCIYQTTQQVCQQLNDHQNFIQMDTV